MGRIITALNWHEDLRAQYGTRISRPRAALPFSATVLRDLERSMHLPALLDDVFCLHLDGAKRFYRKQDGFTKMFDVSNNSMTILPRHRSADWRTEGPDDYVHLTLSPKPFDELINKEYGKTRSGVDLRHEVGFVNPFLLALGNEMLHVASVGGYERLYVDTLFTAFCLALLRFGTNVRESTRVPLAGGRHWKGGMPGWRLRQIVEFMHENSRSDIGLSELSELAGLSRAHFFRAFKQATGTTPGRYLERIRVDGVRRAIEHGCTLQSAAFAEGFATYRAMSRAFRRIMAISPAEYARWYR